MSATPILWYVMLHGQRSCISSSMRDYLFVMRAHVTSRTEVQLQQSDIDTLGQSCSNGMHGGMLLSLFCTHLEIVVVHVQVTDPHSKPDSHGRPDIRSRLPGVSLLHEVQEGGEPAVHLCR